jgi:hypothetical protein
MVRYFFLSMNLLNGLLAVAVAAIAYYAVIPSLNPVARISLSPVEGTIASSGEIATPAQNLPAADYAVISGQNLFHPERKIPPEKQPEKVIPKPDVFLYGTLIADDASYAFIEDKKAPYSTPGRGKRQITLKKGDHLSGYTLNEITADRIVLVKGEEKVVVMLDDRGKRRTGETQAMPATARMDAAGITPSTLLTPSSPQAMPSSPPPVSSPGPGIALPGSRPPSQSIVSPAPPAVPSSPAQAATMPGAGPDPGTGLPTRRTRVQEIQKIKAERQMRAE